MILQNNGISMVTIDPIHPPNCLYPLQHIVIFLLQRRPPSSANGLHEHRISSSRLQPWTTQWNNGRMICCKTLNVQGSKLKYIDPYLSGYGNQAPTHNRTIHTRCFLTVFPDVLFQEICNEKSS